MNHRTEGHIGKGLCGTLIVLLGLCFISEAHPVHVAYHFKPLPPLADVSFKQAWGAIDHPHMSKAQAILYVFGE